MNSSKTFGLLNTLEKQELGLLKKELLSKKRKTLIQLFDLSIKLVKKKNNIDFKKFFELFYNEKYNKAKDNKLRNELRIFNGILELFITNLQINKKLKDDFYFAKLNYLTFLLERQELNQLSIELAKIFKRIEEKEDYNYFYDFFLIWTRASKFGLKMDAIFIGNLKEKFKAYFEKWKIEVGIKTRELELFNSFIERTYYMVSRTMEFTDEVEAIKFLELNNIKYFKFLSLKASFYKHSGAKKIALIYKTIDLLDQIEATDIKIDIEKYVAHQLIGVEHLIESNTEKALASFDESLLFSSNIDDFYFVKGLYNYASASIKIENYARALVIYETYKEKIIKSEVKDLFSAIFTMCYIFTGDIEAAEQTNKIISSNSAVGNFLYSRCNLAIIFYLNNEPELTLNELVNINQTINYHKNQDKAFLDFTSSFKTFINYSISKSILSEKKEKLEKLLEKIKDLMTKSDVYYGSDSLHMVWLMKQIEKTISSQ